MNTRTLIEFGEAWGDLGDAVTEQVVAVLDGEDPLEQNRNALVLALDRIGDFNWELRRHLEEAIEAFDTEEDENV
jgi:hypothetical protein